jgi:ribosomal protein L40E
MGCALRQEPCRLQSGGIASMMIGERDFQGGEAMGKKPDACPKCGSENIKKKKSLKSLTVWGVLFFFALLLTGAQDERVSTGAMALVILLIVPLILYAALAIWGANRCRECKHSW